MEPNANIDSELLARYLTGEATARERLTVEAWSSSSVANAAELDRMRRIWAMAGAEPAIEEVDVDAAWQRVSEQTIRGKVVALRPARSVGWKWMAAAAAFVGVIFLLRMLVSGPVGVQLAASDEFLKTSLADSSLVTLSPGSRLTATIGDQRVIDLTGQAYFEVKRDEARPFIVHAGDMEVTVLGTAFEVTRSEGNDSLSVRVQHGRVGVGRALDTHVMVLNAGEKALWVKGVLLERTVTGPVERWADRIIQFNNAPLQQVVEELNAAYGVRIELGSEAILGCPLTATFGDEPVDQVVRVIANTFGFDVVTNGLSSWTIHGEGC